MATLPSYSIGIEFESGSYTEVGSDCLRLSISRQAADAFSGLSPGAASFIFDNYGARYSPANSASPYNPYLIPNRAINVYGIDTSMDPSTPSMITQQSLTSFTAANIIDKDFASGGWHTDTAPTSAYLQIDFGAGNEKNLSRASIYTYSVPYNGIYNILCSSNGTTWLTAATSFAPSSGGWNTITWTSVGSFRYWRLQLSNTPGGGANLTELTFGLYPLFTGFIDRFRVSPNLETRTVGIEASDRIKTLQLRNIDLPLTTNTNPGSLFVDILSAAAVTSAQRVVDRFYDSIPYAWDSDRRPLDAMNELMQFGYYRMFCGADGRINVKNRYWGIEGSVVGSYINEFFGFDYGLDENKIINNIRISGQPRKLSTSVNTVAWIESIPTIPASSAIGFWLHYVDPDNLELDTPANSMVTPVNSSDYTTNTASDGSGTNRTSVASASVAFFGASAVCSIFNGSGDSVYLTKFQLRGNSIQRQAPILYETNDSSSQNTYGKRDFTLQSDYIADFSYAKDYGTFIKTERKDPTADIEVSLKNVFPDVLARELGDIITLVESNTCVGSNWTIRSINHEVSLARGLEHTVSYGVEYWRDRQYLILDHASRGQLDINRVAF